MTLSFFNHPRTFRDSTAPTRAGIRHWCYGFYCFTVVQWPGRPERLQFPASPPDARHSRLAPSPSMFPHPDGATTGRGIVAAKGCWGYPGGVGKTCCGKEWVASTSLHFCDDDDTIYMPRL